MPRKWDFTKIKIRVIVIDMGKMQKGIHNLIKRYRMRFIKKLLDKEGKTLLDIGCKDASLHGLLKNKHEVILADISPASDLIKKEDVQSMSFKDRSFDIVLCQQVLEHVPNPIKAIAELKRVAKKQLIITVPNEPIFTALRFLFWEKEHLWAVTPAVLKMHLGNPVYEKTFFLKRYYVGIWKIKN